MAQAVYLIGRVIYFYEMLIFLWCLMSFFQTTPGTFLDDCKQVLGRLCLPYLGLFRRFIPPIGGLDFSPVVAILVLTFAERGLSSILL